MAAIFIMAAILFVQTSNILYKSDILSDLGDKGIYILVIMYGNYIYDILQWMSVQNGDHLIQNGRSSVIKFKIHINIKCWPLFVIKRFKSMFEGIENAFLTIWDRCYFKRAANISKWLPIYGIDINLKCLKSLQKNVSIFKV